MNILVFSGSLRRESYNTRLARAAIDLLPDGVTGRLYDGLADLPHYNEDLESDVPPVAQRLREAVAAADAVLIVTPEYNALPSAAVKDVIDWTSRPYGDAAIGGVPVAVLGTSISSNGAIWAQEAVLKSVKIAGAVPFDADPIPVGPHHEKIGDGEILDKQLEARVRDYLAGFVAFAEGLTAAA